MTDIIFSIIPGTGGDLGQILLNRPKALNALTAAMCQSLREQLTQWQQDPQIKAVIIQGEGERAFCAGGDIRALYQNGKENISAAIDFFRNEYSMNAAIFHFKKPYISFLDGITMGGGAGVSIHGSHRIATERLIFAMPETVIGFFPDIGAGYFLSRCKNKMGYYLGLTGARISAEDATSLGFVTHIISHEQKNEIIEQLARTPFKSDHKQQISKIIDSFAITLKSSPLQKHTSLIQHCFSAASVEEIIVRLEEIDDQWSAEIIKTLLSRSPTSLKVTLAHLQQAESMSFDDIMQMEFNIAIEFLRTHDFYEGVRAAVIDKDQTPHWNPSQIADVSHEQVAAFFSFKESL